MKLIRNIKIVDGGEIREGALLLEGEKILAVQGDEKLPEIPMDEVTDGKGLYASAGFIDMHTHGAGGADFLSPKAEDMLTAAFMHLRHGTTTVYPTILSASKKEIEQSICTFQAARKKMKGKMELAGLHLEGPYFALSQMGGQDPNAIRNPDPAEYLPIIEMAEGCIKRWSAAPEVPGALELGDCLVKNGILPSIAHTDATYAQVQEAMRHGYSHITHLYSCTSTITRKGGFRTLGVTEAAYCFDELTVELIADGCHLPPELLRMAVKCKGADKISLVTDSLTPAGTDAETVRLGGESDGRMGIIEDGVIKLPDRSAFAGSIATADRLVRTMWKQAGIPLAATVQMMTENPAKVMHIDDRKGRLLPGMDADIVLFDEDVNIKTVFCCGEAVVNN